MRIKPILWTYDPQKDNKFPVKICVTNTHDKKTTQKYIVLDFRIKQGEWDAKSGRVKMDKHPNASEMNLKIIEQITLIEKNFLTGKPIEKINEDHQNVYYWFDRRITISGTKHAKKTRDKFLTVKRHLQAFAPELKIKDLTLTFIQDFEQHLLNHYRIRSKKPKKLDPNAVAEYLTRLRVIVNEIMDAKAMSRDDYPFATFVITQKRREKKRLDAKQITSLQNIAIPCTKKYISVQLALDLYEYSLNNGGIRFGDLCRLQKSNVKDGRLKYVTGKGQNERSIKQNAKALEIIQRYFALNPNDSMLFPTGIYLAKDASQEERYLEADTIERRGVFLRKKLKLACKLAGIPPITFHTARHSIADIAIQAGVPMRALQGVLGHSTITTTERYAKALYANINDDALDKALESIKAPLLNKIA